MDYAQQENKQLDKIKPDDWYNIPEVIREAIKILIGCLKNNLERIILMSGNQRALDQRVLNREKAHK